ncbi:MAG: tetratricopeptide repeat protein, partial [Candidatus Krumholzibacteriia bacterium]
ILVVAGTATGRPADDRLLDLRVEDSEAPLPELRRLVGVWRAYGQMNAGDVAVEQGDLPAALAHYAAADSLLPASLEVRYWHAVTLAANGRVEQALPIFRAVFALDPNWVDLTRRLVKPGLIPDTAAGRALLAEILREAPPR